jgi:hypothetical protein
MPTLDVPGFDQVSEEMRQANEDVASTTRSIITRYGK